jgi:NADH-quinone oxidoreductase subunit C
LVISIFGKKARWTGTIRKSSRRKSGSQTVTDSTKKDANVVTAHLREWNPKAVEGVVEFRGETTIIVPRELLKATAERCLLDAALQFNLLTDATCVDRFPTEPRFELQYHLVSIPHRQRLRLRTSVPGNHAVVDSLTSVWPGANWLEREIFDLFGVSFTGHPDLRRILLPENWEGHPLRRDYATEGPR